MAAPDALDQPFDYIVVGGGTAGLVVANRLSEDSNVRVLVVEAGADRTADPLVLCPGLVGALYGKDEYDWNFCSPPQETLNNRCVNQARGKMLGGSSALNFMMLLFPSKSNMDAWAALGNPSWTYETMTPYLRKFSTVHGPPTSAKDLLGLTYLNPSLATGDGPVHVSFSEGYSVTNQAWMKAFADAGLSVSSDPRDGTALGAFQNQASIDPATHTRSYAASAYYTPEVAKRPNLVVLTETLVTKVLFNTSSDADSDDVVTTGVEIRTKDGQTKQVSVHPNGRGEVILAAGALQSPQILELSGVGGRDLLTQHGIPVIIDNPNVGEHVQDHPIVCLSYEVADGVPSSDVLRDPSVVQALAGMYQTAGGAGPLGQSVISAAYTPLVDGSGIMPPVAKQALFDAHASTLTTLDAQLIRDLALASPSPISPTPTTPNPNPTPTTNGEPILQFLLFPGQIAIPDQPGSMADYLTPVQPENYITVMAHLNQPFSRGTVHITSADAAARPTWDPRYNSHPLDMEILARAVQFVEGRVVGVGVGEGAGEAAAFGGAVLKRGGKRLPPRPVQGQGEVDLEAARELVRQRQISVFHVSGSCAMRPKEQGGVVDERLRVYGARGLRVVDASVFPIEPVGNIQSVVYAVAERAADIIKADRAAAGAA